VHAAWNDRMRINFVEGGQRASFVHYSLYNDLTKIDTALRMKALRRTPSAGRPLTKKEQRQQKRALRKAKKAADKTEKKAKKAIEEIKAELI
jgi:uncharacterized membrane protein